MLALAILVDVSCPGDFILFGSCIYMLGVITVVPVLLGNYVLRVVAVRMNVSVEKLEDRADNRKYRGGWLMTPVCVLLVGTSILFPWPLWCRFKLSESALTREAHAYLSNPVTTRKKQLIGLYQVRGMQACGTRSVHLELESAWFETYGFVYSPDGLQAVSSWFWTTMDLGDGWWIGGVKD